MKWGESSLYAPAGCVCPKDLTDGTHSYPVHALTKPETMCEKVDAQKERPRSSRVRLADKKEVD